MHTRIKRAGQIIRRGNEFREAGVDVGGDLEAAPASFGDRVRETECFPEIVVAREGEELARDVLDVDEFRGLEIWEVLGGVGGEMQLGLT